MIVVLFFYQKKMIVVLFTLLFLGSFSWPDTSFYNAQNLHGNCNVAGIQKVGLVCIYMWLLEQKNLGPVCAVPMPCGHTIRFCCEGPIAILWERGLRPNNLSRSLCCSIPMWPLIKKKEKRKRKKKGKT